jgi:hypothetical protein
MSQYKLFLENGRELLYGLDKPTGGYFYTEFFTKDESNDPCDTIVESRSALTLSELLLDLWKLYNVFPNKDNLISDWFRAYPPTPMQISMAKLFDVNLLELLEKVEKDVNDNRFPL